MRAMAKHSALRNCRLQAMRKQRGIALVLALWLTILLTVIASGFAFSMRSEAIAARNAISLAQARAAADGAVERTLFELSRPRIADAWSADGTRRTWIENGVQFDVVAVDETSKIDLNMANDTLLKGLLMTSGGLDDQAAARVVDAIADWRDPDDLKRPNGAEEADYRAANLKYGPANAPFETVGELARVLGITPDLYRRVAGNGVIRYATFNPPCDDRIARRVARVARSNLRCGRRLSRAAPGSNRKQAAAPTVSGGAGIWHRSDSGLARPCRGKATRWCNLRPRGGAASR